MIKVEDLTGFEMLELKKVLGAGLGQADEMETMYALAYIFKKRENKTFKHDDALAMTLREVQDFLGTDDEEEPTMPFEDESPKE